MTGQFKQRLKYLFTPESVAIVGASNSPEKWGNRILYNLTRGGYKGRIYPVNPRESEVMGFKAYPGIPDIPAGTDLVVITIPPGAVVGAVRDCIARQVKCTIVITSGFSETGPAGKKIEQEMQELALKSGMPLVGPNCVGIISPPHSLYCHMMPIFPRKGRVAILSQSGSVADMIASRVTSRGLGVSHSISVGNEAVLQVADYLEYLADDEDTSVVLGYIEGLRDGHRFLEVARKVTLKKPVILLKAGSTPVGARAGQSHTGALAGSDTVVDAALRQAGIIRAKTIDEMVDAGLVFNNQPLPRGNRVGIIAPGGGWGVMAADACTQAGLDVAALDEMTINRLNAILPDVWSHNNPVDTIAGTKGSIAELLDILTASPSIDGVIALGAVAGAPSLWRYLEGSNNKEEMTERYAHGSMDFLNKSFDDMLKVRDRYRKPVVMAMFMPVHLAKVMDAMSKMAEKTGTATFLSPAQACEAYGALWKYASHLKGPG
jgi:acyl-CoA synthetase (NDP forming)